jgi:uncharacterized membrane protein
MGVIRHDFTNTSIGSMESTSNENILIQLRALREELRASREESREESRASREESRELREEFRRNSENVYAVLNELKSLQEANIAILQELSKLCMLDEF